MTLDQLLKLDPRTLRTQNRDRLQALGLPADILQPGFWEREREARQRELAMLALFEAMWKAGAWERLDLPFEAIIARWKACLESPLYFSSADHRPRWYTNIQNLLAECRKKRTGQRGRWQVLNQRRKAAIQHEAGTRKKIKNRPSKYIEGAVTADPVKP